MCEDKQRANRKHLADATTRYFEQSGSHILVEENGLAKDMMSAVTRVDLDEEC